eukprot:470400-Rhodomonas_salina.1
MELDIVRAMRARDADACMCCTASQPELGQSRREHNFGEENGVFEGGVSSSFQNEPRFAATPTLYHASGTVGKRSAALRKQRRASCTCPFDRSDDPSP